MRKEFLFFFLLLAISVFYISKYIVFGQQGSEISSILGGAVIFVLILPWIGIAFLKKIPNRRLWLLVALSCVFNIGINHLFSFFSKHNFHFNTLVNLYLVTIPSALYFFTLTNLFASILKEPAHDNNAQLFYKKLRLLPLIHLVFGLGYGLLAGLCLIDTLKNPNELRILFLTVTMSYAVLAVPYFYVLSKIPDSTIEFFLRKSERSPFSKADKYFVLILIFNTILSGFFEMGRRDWLFWSFNTLSWLVLLGSQWKFIRHLFMNPKITDSIEMDKTLIKVTGTKFLFYNSLTFAIISTVVISLAHFFKQ